MPGTSLPEMAMLWLHQLLCFDFQLLRFHFSCFQFKLSNAQTTRLVQERLAQQYPGVEIVLVAFCEKDDSIHQVLLSLENAMSLFL